MSAETFDAIAQRMGRCDHFTGTQHPTCAAGLAYDDVRAAAGGLPCLAAFAKPGVTCARRRFPTREEAQAWFEEGRAYTALVFEAIEAGLKDADARNASSGSIPCPKCGESISYWIAGGHMHGSCATPNCLTWRLR